MNNNVEIDPTDPVFSYEHDDNPLEVVQTGFHEAQSHFPRFMDPIVSMQIVQDLVMMADIRFRDLCTPVLDSITEAAEQYDVVHPRVKAHQPHGKSALPNWEVVIGLTLDEDLLMDRPMTPLQNTGTVNSHEPSRISVPTRPVITGVETAAFYHTYHYSDGPCETRCTHMTDDLFSYDSCIFIREQDLQNFHAPPLYLLSPDLYREFLIELTDAKVNSLLEAQEYHDLRYVFQGYAAPLVHTVQDFNRARDAIE